MQVLRNGHCAEWMAYECRSGVRITEDPVGLRRVGGPQGVNSTFHVFRHAGSKYTGLGYADQSIQAWGIPASICRPQ